ncbi:hypothetical protein COT42_06665 [Candidatus Saganbacteria bacterium CG08_land_8_20_14_0_20_45_16]|uniref:Polysaccharide chain length determinant N-terminal domain-containing protein n=1 Tax=Candidatus Saganbacteria bacterium CG08_land_8_20_14_0_20_45_16 TaxID=2014293 RepID=A0A2H0XVG5_UNCSA|nr:MAG: hypothetical protein COT42_06665 [Candidatus Saganbacteria bacterium CG08_land_8_20_14_0_20_45_16]
MDDEINLLEYWQVIVKRKWLIIGLAFVCAFVALVYSLIEPKMYKATATLMLVDSGRGGLGSALSALSFLGGGSGAGGGASQLLPIVRSRALAEQVAEQIDRQKYFSKLLSNKKMTPDKIEQAIVSSLRGAIEAKSADLFELSIVWPEPLPAAELANIYVENLGRFLNSRSLNTNFQVIDPAVEPDAPFNKKTKLNAMIGLVLGLFIGIFIAFFMEYIEKASLASPLTSH